MKVFWEFPHLKEWCGKHLRAPGCYHGYVDAGRDVVEKYQHTLHANIIGDNPEKTIYTGPVHLSGVYRDCTYGQFVLELMNTNPKNHHQIQSRRKS